MLIDKQDLSHFTQAFVNYLPDAAADQRAHATALGNIVGFVHIPVHQGLAIPRKQQYFFSHEVSAWRYSKHQFTHSKVNNTCHVMLQ